MSYLKTFFALLFLLIVSTSLTGCFLTSPSPEPGEIVQMEMGDNRTFTVVSSKPQDFGMRRYYNEWIAEPVVGDYIEKQQGNDEFEFKTELYGALPNKINLSCTLFEDRIKFTGELGRIPIGGCPIPGYCGPSIIVPSMDQFIQAMDQIVWSIKINQDPPTWNGDYIIENETDLQELKDFSEITGNLIIIVTLLSDLQELDNIKSIGGNLEIRGNDNLTSLEGLSSELTSIGRHLSISDNHGLINLSGLGKTTSIGKSLSIRDNDRLINLSGLDNITSIGGGLQIEANTLTSLEGLNSLCRVDGIIYNRSIKIIENDLLCSNLAEDLRDQIVDCMNPDVLSGAIDISDNKDCP